MKNYLNKKTKKTPVPKPPKKKSAKKFWIVAIVLIVILLGMNFLLSNQPYETLKAWIFKEEKTELYLVYNSFSSRDRAYAQSLLVRQSGAGGYIYQKDEEYRVVYSIYTEKEDAEIVAEKNPPVNMVAKEINTKDDTIKYIYTSLIELTDYATQLEDGTIYEARLLEICSIIRLRMDEKKQALLEEDASETTYINVLDIIIGGLSSLNVPGFSRVTLLSDLRYIIISALMSLPD